MDEEAIARDGLCTLGECPPGLFHFGNTLAFKSEYKTRAGGEFGDGFYQSDAYCVETGEYFRGGAQSAQEREKLIVRPVATAILAFQSSEGGNAKPTARDLFEIARPCFHYASRGTGDGSMFEASETGRLLMKAMEAIAAASLPDPNP